ncbi:bifunctional folylpolyglutamate synthase/dihydrofolate synthase [bacterium SCSIO 12696]|nr:bifunctional folylpolyglutamate synthase/dihydrofolate synthase [bacterium SCSIO 12696]
MSNPSSLEEWLKLLEGRHRQQIELGLNRVAEVYQHLGIVSPAPTVISIAGTNGKGSCVAVLTAILETAGLTVGSYTSPHLLRFNERIAIHGQPVDDARLCLAFETVENARGEVLLTYFEFTTLAAFVVMAEAQVDVAVLEVGLGGRLDAVNVVDADIAVITSIDLDHQEYLGDTREAVASEKLGIARAGKPLICGEENLPANFADEVSRIGCHSSYLGQDFQYPAEITQAARLPIPSVACAIQAASLLGYLPPREQLLSVLAEVRLPGRFQRIPVGDRELILDVAHNPAAAELLALRLRQTGKQCQAVVAMMADKDMDGVLQPMVELSEHWFLAPLTNMPRAASPDTIAELLYNNGLNSSQFESVGAAIEQALEAAGPGGRAVVFGSFFTVAAGLQWLQRNGVTSVE